MRGGADPDVQDYDEWLEGQQDEARRCLNEISAGGKAVLEDGTVIKAGMPGFSDMLRHWHWIIGLKPPKKTKVPLPEDFQLKSTQKEAPSGA